MQGREIVWKICMGFYFYFSFIGQTSAVVWWLGVVIIISTYTANLTAHLTASRSKTTINSVEDLGTQYKIQYGIVIFQSLLLNTTRPVI